MEQVLLLQLRREPVHRQVHLYDADFYGDEEIGSVEHSAESLSTGKSPKL